MMFHALAWLDIDLEVSLQPEGATRPTTICRTNFRHMYWSMAQQFAHHTASGCNVRIGDLMGSGTISGSAEDSFGSLLELTRNGKTPLELDGSVERCFIKDGDTVLKQATLADPVWNRLQNEGHHV